jgi:hypothetical protein
MIHARDKMVFVLSMVVLVALIWMQEARADSTETIQAYDVWKLMLLVVPGGIANPLEYNEGDSRYQGRCARFHPRGYEKDPGLRVWSHSIRPG